MQSRNEHMGKPAQVSSGRLALGNCDFWVGFRGCQGLGARGWPPKNDHKRPTTPTTTFSGAKIERRPEQTLGSRSRLQAEAPLPGLPRRLRCGAEAQQVRLQPRLEKNRGPRGLEGPRVQSISAFRGLLAPLSITSFRWPCRFV